MFSDPLAMYQLPRDSQVELLGMLWADANPEAPESDDPVDLADLEDYMTVGLPPSATDGADPEDPYSNPDPDQGSRMRRPTCLAAVSTDARQRADRFRVS